MKTTVITIDWPRSLFLFISACSISWWESFRSEEKISLVDERDRSSPEVVRRRAVALDPVPDDPGERAHELPLAADRVAGQVESDPADDLVAEARALVSHVAIDREEQVGADPVVERLAHVAGVELRPWVRVVPTERHVGVQARLDPLAEGRRARASTAAVDVDDVEGARPDLVQVERRLLVEARQRLALEHRVHDVDRERRRPPGLGRRGG